MTVFTKDDFPETDTHKKDPFTQGWEDSEASPVRGGQVWALQQLFLIHQRKGSFERQADCQGRNPAQSCQGSSWQGVETGGLE